MGNKEQRIKEMLGFGISQEAVANAVGVTPGYISQLMSQEEFASAVAELTITHTVAKTQRDLSYDALEDKLLVTMHDMVDQGRFQKPEQVLMALRTSNQMIRRGATGNGVPKETKVVINLSLPTVVRDRFIPNMGKADSFKTNSQGEVIEVNGHTTVTMGSKQLVKEIIQDKKEGGQDEGDFTKLSNQIQRISHG